MKERSGGSVVIMRALLRQATRSLKAGVPPFEAESAPERGNINRGSEVREKQETGSFSAVRCDQSLVSAG